MREKAICLILPVVRAFPGYAYNEEEMVEVVQHFGEALSDSYAAVMDAAVGQLQECKGTVPGFDRILGKLPASLRRKCEEMIRAGPENRGEVADLEVLRPVKLPHFPEATKSPMDALRTFSDSFTSGVDFGFLPSKLLIRLSDKENWKDRVAALSETESILKSLDTLQSLYAHLPGFLGLLSELICDKNMKICTSGLNLTEFLLSDLTLCQQADLIPVVQVCITRLGDSKILIRQASFRCLRKIMAVIRLGKLLQLMIEALRNANWHIREEVLNVLLACMLTPDQVHDVDFLELVPAIMPLIDDEKPKVRFVAQETLAVLSHVCGKERVVAELAPLLDTCALRSLEEKFNRKTVPIVREDYIEFPRVAPASAPIQHTIHHSPFPSAVPTPSGTQASFAFNDPFPAPSDHISTEADTQEGYQSMPRRRLKSASKRADINIFHPPEFDTMQTQETSIPTSTRGSSLNPLRINRRRAIRPVASTKAPDVTDTAGYEIPAPGQDLTPLRGTKMKDNTRVIVTQTPVKALPDKDLSSADNLTYIKTEDLQPADNPSEALSRMIKGMQSDDWLLQFDALNTCRSLLKHSSDLLKALNFHEIIFQVLLMADSLRSSLSKNSLMTLSDMCQFLPRSLDSDIDAISSLLLRKAVDTNIFLSESALKALTFMCQYCNEGKVVTGILANLTATRSSLVKAKSAYCFEALFKRMDVRVAKMRELDRVLKKLAEFSTEASPEVRSCAKSALKCLSNCLLNSGEIDKLLFRCLSTDEFKQVKAFMTAPTLSIRPGRSIRFRTQSPLLDSLKQAGRAGSQPPPVLPSELAEQLRIIQANIGDGNWQTRSGAVTQAAELILTCRDIKKIGKLVVAVDILGKGLGDKNVNVVFKALEATKAVVCGEEKEALAGHCLVFVEGLVGAMGSGNASVRAASRDVFSVLTKQWEPGTLVQPLVGCLSSATDKAKTSVFQALIDIAPKLYQKRPSLIHKHLIPALKLICGEHRTELRQLAIRLAKSLYDLLGAELLESLNADQLPRVMEALSS